MYKNFFVFCSCLVFLSFCFTPATKAFIIRLITDTLQNNVAGEPLLHQSTQWDFDPDISQKRRAQYYEVNGFRSAKFIERIGLGDDGHEEERREAQRVRDAGLLNGEHEIVAPTAIQ